MSQKVERPTLSGHKIKTRKRDEKEKRDPIIFRDLIVKGLNDCNKNLEAVTTFLVKTGATQNYRLYADSLIQILIAGGLLAPGGGLIEDQQDPTKATRSDVCIFLCDGEAETLNEYVNIFVLLIRRYRYLEKIFEDEMTARIIPCMKGYSEEEREKLAKATARLIRNNQLTPKCLKGLFEDHLVKDDLALRFATVFFRSWLEVNTIKEIRKSLQGCGWEGHLMKLFPIHKRSADTFNKHFEAAGLQPIIDYQKRYETDQMKKKIEEEVKEMIDEEEAYPVKEIIEVVKDSVKTVNLNEADIIINLWNAVMSSVEWNKKEELLADQALRHLKNYAQLLAAFTESPKSELMLIQRVQEYCYDNMSFMNVFRKIIMLLYQTDVLSEDIIFLWYKEKSHTKGRSTFLSQMEKFINWLEKAEEESDDDEEVEEK